MQSRYILSIGVATLANKKALYVMLVDCVPHSPKLHRHAAQVVRIFSPRKIF